MAGTGTILVRVIEPSTEVAGSSKVPQPNATAATSPSKVKAEVAISTPVYVAPTTTDPHEWF